MISIGYALPLWPKEPADPAQMSFEAGNLSLTAAKSFTSVYATHVNILTSATSNGFCNSSSAVAERSATVRRDGSHLRLRCQA